MTWSLLPYQRAWIRETAPLAVIEKSRRIGISWAEAYHAVMHAADDRGDIYYQSYDRDMTRGFIEDCAGWIEGLDVSARQVGEQILDNDGRDIQVFRINFASGRRIIAMTSSPRGFRSKGRPGDLAIVDEAAFVDNIDAVLKAALAFTNWGGRVRIISTHNGEGNAFNALLRDIRDGRKPGVVHRVTLREITTLRDAPFSEQRAEVRRLAALYRPLRIVVDQTGMGEAVVEQLQEDHGRMTVEGVLLTAPRRLDAASGLREAFEDRRIRIPPDEALRADLHSVRAEPGATGAPRLVAERAGTDGHADRFWAMALAVLGANSTAGPFRATVAGTPSPARAAWGGRPGYEIDPAAGMVRSQLDPIRSWRM